MNAPENRLSAEEFQNLYGLEPSMVEGLVESQKLLKQHGQDLDLERIYQMEVGDLPEPSEEAERRLRLNREANAPELDDDPVAAAHWGGRLRQAYLRNRQAHEPSA